VSFAWQIVIILGCTAALVALGLGIAFRAPGAPEGKVTSTGVAPLTCDCEEPIARRLANGRLYCKRCELPL
jgi:hypothetical protein